LDNSTPLSYVPALVIPGNPSISSAIPSSSNLVLNAVNGGGGDMVTTLASTNVALPLSQWQRVATNYLVTNGNFTITITNGIAPGYSPHFYTMEFQ
jgi:hypothetical protein